MPLSVTIPDDLQEISLPSGTRIRWGRTSTGQRLLLSPAAGHPVVMHFTLTGTTAVYVETLNRSINIRGNQHNLIYPAGGNSWLDSATAQPCQFLQIYLVPDFFSLTPEDNGPTFRHLANVVQARQPVCLAAENLSVTTTMHAVVAQITACPLTCSLKRLFLEAKVLELLALQLGQYEQALTAVGPGVRLPEYDKIIEARRVLEARFDHPPTLPELSRLVGLNEFKLKKSFKAVFGDTIHGWVLTYRLNRAYQLLQSHPLTISEVAYQVGYQHPAHFTTAFKKLFGIVPSEVR